MIDRERLGQDEPQRFIPFLTNEVTNVAKLYASVFAGEPWNEVTRCGCGKFFGAETEVGQDCECFKSKLAEAYPLAETIGYIKKELGRTDAKGFTMKEGTEVVGFSWGFPYQSPNQFSFDKYRTPEMRGGMSELLAQNGVDSKFFYFSECGVDSNSRGKGYSNKLSGSLVNVARWAGLPLIMRTNAQSPMIAVADRFNMTQLMGPQAEIDREQREIKVTDTIVNDVLDLENPDRVLFMLR
ncbi:MAG: hypothetical protein AAB478_05025 [Patescibacteria group bacterium]